MKVLVSGGGTGGHLTPALAIADGLRARRPDADIVLIGARRGIEARLLPDRPYPFHLVSGEPLYRAAWWRNLRWLGLARRLLREIDAVLDGEAPDLVVGTGGYAAGPVVWRAARRGIPTAIHDANAFPGFATRLLARVARHVYLGFPEARTRLRPGRNTAIFVTGNPIHPPRVRDASAARRALGLDEGCPVVLISGGSQGAHALNLAVAGAVEEGLLGNAGLVWCTGHAHHRAVVGLAEPGRVVITPFLDPLDDAYAAAALAVTRAGAITLAELAAWGVPAILVPLPTAAHDHQTHNARAVELSGGAMLLPERDLTAGSLARGVSDLLRNADRLSGMAAAQRHRARPEATATVVSHLLTLVS